LVVQPKAGGGREILIQASNLHAYFGLLKYCHAAGVIESADPSFGTIVALVDGSSAKAIATEVASFDLSRCAADLTSLMSAPSLEGLAEWLLYVPADPENYALTLLLAAGKIRVEHEWIDGRESVVFTASGSIEELPEVFRNLPLESTILKLVLKGELGFHLAARNGKPAIVWRLLNRCGALSSDASCESMPNKEPGGGND
jgi:hypothetical protein